MQEKCRLQEPRRDVPPINRPVERDETITALGSGLCPGTTGIHLVGYDVAATLNPPDPVVWSDKLLLLAIVDPRQRDCGHSQENQKASRESNLEIPLHRKIDWVG